jgi:hypothetical protein
VGGVPMSANPLFFRRFADNWPAVKARAVDAAKRSKESVAFARALPGFLAQRNAREGDFLYFPYTGHDGACTLAFTPDGGRVEALGCENY